MASLWHHSVIADGHLHRDGASSQLAQGEEEEALRITVARIMTLGDERSTSLGLTVGVDPDDGDATDGEGDENGEKYHSGVLIDPSPEAEDGGHGN